MHPGLWNPLDRLMRVDISLVFSSSALGTHSSAYGSPASNKQLLLSYSVHAQRLSCLSLVGDFFSFVIVILCKAQWFALVGPGIVAIAALLSLSDLRTRVVFPLQWISHDVRWHFVIRVSSADWRANGKHHFSIFYCDRNPKYGIKL